MTAASRVIEIDEVLLAKMVSGRQTGASARKTAAFASKLSVTAFDSDVGRGQVSQLNGGFQAGERLPPCFLGEAPFLHVARESFDDPRRPALQKLRGSIGEHHRESCAQHHVGNPVAHLPRANYAHDFDFHVPPLR